MKMRRIFLLALILIMAVFFTACGGDEPITDPEPEDESIRVSSTEELFAAIAPDAKIIIEPGYYNLSEFVETIDYDARIEWNDTQRYIRIEECYDGNDVIIQNVEGLSITGGGETYSDTEIVVDPRYAAIFTFDNCAELTLSNMTMGHTIYSDCSGNVLNFYGCDGVSLEQMDLYGCGVYGICTQKNWGNVTVKDSIIRDCEYGSIDIWEGTGRYEFSNCLFTGSWGGGYYEKTDNSELCFYKCEFGDSETNTWYFNEDIVAEDCVWGEVTSYPEY